MKCAWTVLALETVNVERAVATTIAELLCYRSRSEITSSRGGNESQLVAVAKVE